MKKRIIYILLLIVFLVAGICIVVKQMPESQKKEMDIAGENENSDELEINGESNPDDTKDVQDGLEVPVDYDGNTEESEAEQTSGDEDDVELPAVPIQ